MVYLAIYDEDLNVIGFEDMDGISYSIEYKTKIENEAGSTITYKNQTELDALALKASIKKLGIATDRYIQSVIESYNDELGLAFGSVHNCESYSRVANYTHQPFCVAVWDWSVNVWETVRSLSTMPTDAEFKTILNSVSTNDTALQVRLDSIDPII